MFFATRPDLLRPIHSLLKTPFAFAAGDSIGMKLRHRLQAREDFEDLLALGCLFDKARQAVGPSLTSLRTRLEEDISLVVPTNADLSSVCESHFTGGAPGVFGMNGAQYLSHVSVQCQLERLYDLFGLRRYGASNPLNAKEATDAVKLLMLSEALAFALAGIATVKRSGIGFEISTHGPAAAQVLRNTWFARAADQFSQAGTIALVQQLARSDADHVSRLEVLTVRILDQDLSIPWHRLSKVGRSLKSVKQIRTAVEVVALLAVLGARDKPLKMTGPALAQFGVDFGTVSSLIQQQVNGLATDQFLVRHGDMLNLRIEAASKGLRTMLRSFAEEFGERDALRIHVGGEFYEKTHIRHRIEQGGDYAPRYRIHDGFDRYKVIGGAPNECDVEFIVQDVEQRHYYFIQVKHALLGEKAFLGAVIEALQKDLGKGMHQLREAKRLLSEGLLVDTLRARGIDDAVPANSSFVLLHNIAQFDFQHSGDGISLYDWATFRNLLKDGECSYGHSNGPMELVRLPTPLIVSHPTDVIHRLLDEHPAYRRTYADPWAQERASTRYKILDRPIQVRGLGI